MKKAVDSLHAYYFYDGAARAFESALDCLNQALTDKANMTVEQRLIAYKAALRDLVVEYDEQSELSLSFAMVDSENRNR